METIHCPECDAPIKILGSGESFDGWRRCSSCGEYTHIMATESEEISKQSLISMLEKLKKNKTGIQTLQFIMDSGTVQERNVVFCVGKQSQTFLDLMVNIGILERNGRRYNVKKIFEEPVHDYIESNIRKKSYDTRDLSRNQVSI